METESDSKITQSSNVCNTCKQMFNNNEELGTHILTHSSETFKCVHSNTCFKDKSSLDEHCISHCKDEISRNDNNVCELCGHNMETKSDSKIIQSRKVCKTCEKTFNNKEGLAVKKHVLEDYICGVCGKKINQKSILRHCRSHSDEKPHVCEICGKGFFERSKLTRHSRIHTVEKLFQCMVCNKRFNKNSDLKNHVLLHGKAEHSDEMKKEQPSEVKIPNKEEIYPCKMCDKTFALKSKLRNHLRYCSGKKPHVCEICGKGFVERTKLTRHYRIHTGEKPFQCMVCNKRFNKNSDLKNHVLLHGKADDSDEVKKEQPSEVKILNKEEIYPCKMCDKTFDMKSKLRNHLRYCSCEKTFLCELCEKCFVSKSALAEHQMMSCDTDNIMQEDAQVDSKITQSSSVCNTCVQTFSSKEELGAHILTHSSETFKCFYCDMCFKDKSSLFEHCISHCRDEISQNDKNVYELRGHNMETESDSKIIQSSNVWNTCEQTFNNNELAEKMHVLEDYICPFCGRKFKQRATMLTHCRWHSGEKLHVCEICGKGFVERSKLTLHYLIHTDEKSFQCTVCNKRFNKNSDLKNHVLLHGKAEDSDEVKKEQPSEVKIPNKEEIYPCKMCDKTFDMKSKLRNHLQYCSSEEPVLCELCGKCFVSKSALAQHQAMSCDTDNIMQEDAHVDSKITQSSNVCNTCVQTFSSKEELDAHILTHSSETFKCGHCDMSFKDKSSLHEHCISHCRDEISRNDKNVYELCGHNMETESDSKITQSSKVRNTCEQTFNNKEELAEKMHVLAIHTCPVCGRTFRERATMLRHCRWHTGEKPYVCEICGKGFFDRSRLTQHYLVHTGEKPFQCTVCKRRFNKKSSLTKHGFRLHGKAEDTDEAKKEQPSEVNISNKEEICEIYPCKLCDKIFDMKPKLRNHLRYCSGEKPFLCELCGKCFVSKSALTQHQRIHTGEKPFQCEICDKRFNKKSSLTKHCLVHMPPVHPADGKEVSHESQDSKPRDTDNIMQKDAQVEDRKCKNIFVKYMISNL